MVSRSRARVCVHGTVWKRSRTRFSRRYGTDAQRKLGTDAGKLLARRAAVAAVAVAAAMPAQRRRSRRRRRPRRVGAGARRSPIIGYLKMPLDCFSSSSGGGGPAYPPPKYFVTRARRRPSYPAHETRTLDVVDVCIIYIYNIYMWLYCYTRLGFF